MLLQSDFTVNFQRFFFAVTPLLLLVVAIILTVRFPPTHLRLVEIQSKLKSSQTEIG